MSAARRADEHESAARPMCAAALSRDRCLLDRSEEDSVAQVGTVHDTPTQQAGHLPPSLAVRRWFLVLAPALAAMTATGGLYGLVVLVGLL
jgi:hypothetical protein